jgi:hypothetical protein
MSIAMGRFESSAQLLESPALTELRNLLFPYHQQCRSCGFEPNDMSAPPLRCPKCAGYAWERFPYPRSLLAQANRHMEESRQKNADAVTPPHCRGQEFNDGGGGLEDRLCRQDTKSTDRMFQAFNQRRFP